MFLDSQGCLSLHSISGINCSAQDDTQIENMAKARRKTGGLRFDYAVK